MYSTIWKKFGLRISSDSTSLPLTIEFLPGNSRFGAYSRSSVSRLSLVVVFLSYLTTNYIKLRPDRFRHGQYNKLFSNISRVGHCTARGIVGVFK
jgi:hypothetical protein